MVLAARTEGRMRLARAFTLIELPIVIGIISLLVGITIPAAMSVRRHAEVTKPGASIQMIGLELETYDNDFGNYADTGGYPPSSLRDLDGETNGENGEGDDIMPWSSK